MRIFIAVSGKQVPELYHYTTMQAMLKILNSGKLALSTGRGITVEQKHASGKTYFASFTRSRVGGYHYRHGDASKYNEGSVLITVDGTALANKYKIAPIDYWERRGDLDPEQSRNKEYEERLLTNSPEIPFLKYIKRVDFIVSASQLSSATKLLRGRESVEKNEREGKYLGSIVLRLKTNKIPYSFYSSMDDWAKKRGEISYLAEKKVHVDGPASRYMVASKRTYKDMTDLLACLSDTPYEALTKEQKDKCYTAAAYPQDHSSLFNDYDNNRKPEASPELRALAQKIARVMHRRGLNGSQEGSKFIAAKYNVYDKKIRDEVALRQAKILAEDLLQLHDGNFKPLENHANALRSILYKEPYGYLHRETAALVDKALTAGTDEANKLRKLVDEAGGSQSLVSVLHKKLVNAGIEMEY